MIKTIYLDNAASTKLDEAVIEAMAGFMKNNYAVASSQFSHRPGILVKEALDNSRNTLAKAIGAKDEEIIFTSGGTEANNLALFGTAKAAAGKKNHLITTKIEHRSVKDSAAELERSGLRVSYLDVDNEGFVNLNQLADKIDDSTFLVSVQFANQEVGTIQNIEKIGKICKERGVIFHTDAALSFPSIPIDVNRLNIDLATFSAHKMHGPKGAGALYVRNKTAIKKIMMGGFNEFNLRGGTENVPAIVGFAEAIKRFKREDTDKVRKLRDALWRRISESVEDVNINGPKDFSKRLAGNLNCSFDRVEGESIVLHMDMKGIAVITGSACFSRSLEPSYVMMALGFSHERAHSSIRYSFGKFNSEDEVEIVAEVTKEVVERLREISPVKKVI